MNEKFLSDFRRFEELLPVVLPVFVAAGDDTELGRDACDRILFLQERDGFRRVLAGLEVDVDDAFGAVLVFQCFVDEIDVGDLVDLLFEEPVVLEVDAVGHRHMGDVPGGVDAFRGDLDADFGPGVGIGAGGVGAGAFRKAGLFIHGQSSVSNSFATGSGCSARPGLYSATLSKFQSRAENSPAFTFV